MKTYMSRKAHPEQGIEIVREGEITRVYFDFEDSENTIAMGDETPVTEEITTAEVVDVVGLAGYGEIASAIINDRYTNDKMQAVIANWLNADTVEDDAKRSEYAAEYETMQQWRKHAKEVAHKAVAMMQQ